MDAKVQELFQVGSVGEGEGRGGGLQPGQGAEERSALKPQEELEGGCEMLNGENAFPNRRSVSWQPRNLAPLVWALPLTLFIVQGMSFTISETWFPHL